MAQAGSHQMSGSRTSRRSKKLLIVLGLWVALFAGTIVVRHLSARWRVYASAAMQAEQAQALSDLENQPRKRSHSAVLFAALAGSGSGTHAPDMAMLETGNKVFEQFTMQNRERIRACKNLVLSRSKRSVEYVELSVLVRTANASQLGLLGAKETSDLLVNRTSLAVSQEAEACLIQAFHDLPDVIALSLGAVTDFQGTYQFCFSR
jgi:hypothetical protein